MFCEFGSANTSLRRMASMEVFRHRPCFKKLPEPCRLTSRIAKRMGGLLVVQTQQCGGSHGGPERTAGRGVVPNSVMLSAHRHADTGRCLKSMEN